MTIELKDGTLVNYDNIVSIGIENAAINGRYQITAKGPGNDNNICLGIYQTEAEVARAINGIKYAISAGSRLYKMQM